jgi:hypothetical protein
VPFGEGSYKNDGTVYTAGTPGAYGVVECKRMLERRAKEKKVPIPPGFKAASGYRLTASVAPARCALASSPTYARPASRRA